MFSKKELFTALSETIVSLMMEDKYYIFSFLTPSNILYTEESGKEYFFLDEIFLETDSNDKEKEIELTISNEWLVPEFQTKKSKITFSSNICCLGYLFYRIIFGEKPFKNEKERKEKKIPKLNYDSNSIKYKELIENCIKIDYNERWSIEDIQNYISENILEEKSLDEENIDTKEIKEEDEKIIINIDNKKDNITEEKNNSDKKNENKKFLYEIIENNENKKIIHKEDKYNNNNDFFN